MDANALEATITADFETELSRLSSSKALYALTAGDMEPEAVVAALADRAQTAAETFADWPMDAVTEAAATIQGWADAIAETNGIEGSDSPTPLDEYLRSLDTPSAQAGGFLAWTHIFDGALSQAVGFFVGSADPEAADRFRSWRSELSTHQAAAHDLLETVCETDEDWQVARTAASETIDHAYADYVDVLEGLGINVKPVC